MESITMCKTKVTSEEKFKAIEAFLEGAGSQKSCLRGLQHTSKQYKAKLNAVGMTQNMSRVGRDIDKSFISTTTGADSAGWTSWL